MLFGTIWKLDLLEKLLEGLIVSHRPSLGEHPEEKPELNQLAIPLFHKSASNLHSNGVSNSCEVAALILHMLVSRHEEVVTFLHASEVREGLTSPSMLP